MPLLIYKVGVDKDYKTFFPAKQKILDKTPPTYICSCHYRHISLTLSTLVKPIVGKYQTVFSDKKKLFFLLK